MIGFISSLFTRGEPAMSEALARDFIAAEIELGVTFDQVAIPESMYGEQQRSGAAKVKAVQACAEAEHWLDKAEARGWDVRELRRQLRLLREALARLDQEKRKAA